MVRLLRKRRGRNKALCRRLKFGQTNPISPSPWQSANHAVRRQSLTERREPDQIAKQDCRFHYPIGNHRLAIA
jgi:hypothetical protein